MTVKDDPTLSRRGLLVASGAAALQAACSRVPAPACCAPNAPLFFPPEEPVPPTPLGGFTPERLHLVAFDQIHEADADVFTPKSVAELQCLVRAAWKAKRKITVRGGGMSLGQQSLGATVIRLDAPAFSWIDEVKAVGDEHHLRCGAGTRWATIVQTIAEKGFVPRTVVTTGDASIGGTSAVDGVSRMSPFVGKEGDQVVRFTMVDGKGELHTFERPASGDAPSALLAAVAGFGTVGVMTEVTIKVQRALRGQARRPTVETRATRLMPGTFHWGELLRTVVDRTNEAGQLHRAYHAGHDVQDGTGPKRGPVMGLSVVAWPAGGGLAVDRLEHRYVLDERLPPIPGGLYTVNDWDARFAEKIAGYSDTLTELVSTVAFPNGYFVDDLCGFLFFLGNNATPAAREVWATGHRLNYVQQTFVIPARKRATDGELDVEPTRRFVEAIQARASERRLRPFSIDFLFLPPDSAFLSATRDLEGFAVTITIADHDARQWPLVREMFMALSRDTLELGGRVHLVKNVEADPWVLRRMYQAGLEELWKVKEELDPADILHNEFYDRYFQKHPKEPT